MVLRRDHNKEILILNNFPESLRSRPVHGEEDVTVLIAERLRGRTHDNRLCSLIPVPKIY